MTGEAASAAACLGATSLFFSRWRVSEAQAVCGRCRIADECAAGVVDEVHVSDGGVPVVWGVRAGLSPAEQIALWRVVQGGAARPVSVVEARRLVGS